MLCTTTPALLALRERHLRGRNGPITNTIISLHVFCFYFVNDRYQRLRIWQLRQGRFELTGRLELSGEVFGRFILCIIPDNPTVLGLPKLKSL